MKGYLTLREAAEYLGVSKSRVRQFVNEGRLPVEEIGGGALLVIPRADLARFKRKPRKPGRPWPKARRESRGGG